MTGFGFGHEVAAKALKGVFVSADRANLRYFAFSFLLTLPDLLKMNDMAKQQSSVSNFNGKPDFGSRFTIIHLFLEFCVLMIGTDSSQLVIHWIWTLCHSQSITS